MEGGVGNAEFGMRNGELGMAEWRRCFWEEGVGTWSVCAEKRRGFGAKAVSTFADLLPTSLQLRRVRLPPQSKWGEAVGGDGTGDRGGTPR